MEAGGRKATPSQAESLGRLAALAGLFMSSRKPLSTGEVLRQVYLGYDNRDSAEARFLKDRESFALRGFPIEMVGKSGDERLWAVADGTFAGAVELDHDELLVLAGAMRALIDDASFPYSDDLRSALLKVAGSLDRALPSTPLADEPEELGEAARTVARAVAERRGLEVTYENAKGEVSERQLAPWGAYSLRGSTYIVAAKLADMGAEGEPELRRFRLDRFLDARLLDDTFEVPEDFFVEDMLLLPFQIGDEDFELEMAVPEARVAEMRNAVGDAARVRDTPEGAVLSAHGRSMRAAAAWAIDRGLRPLSPPALVDAWKSLLEGVAR